MREEEERKGRKGEGRAEGRGKSEERGREGRGGEKREGKEQGEHERKGETTVRKCFHVMLSFPELLGFQQAEDTAPKTSSFLLFPLESGAA